VKIFHSSGLSVSFMLYFCAETHTQTRISSFFFLSLSFTCSTLCGVYFLFLSLTTLLFTLHLSLPHAAPHKLYQHCYACNYILPSHTFYRNIDTTLMLLSFLWIVIFIRILSYQTDSNIAGFMSPYAITVRSGVFATDSYKVTAC
jgi:hypothetical protein